MKDKTVWALMEIYEDGAFEVVLFENKEEAIVEGLTAIEDHGGTTKQYDDFEEYLVFDDGIFKMKIEEKTIL